jgi:hypothetical protein
MRGKRERQRRIDQARAGGLRAPDPRLHPLSGVPLPATFVAEAIEYLESPARIPEQHELERRARAIGTAAQRRRHEAGEAQRVRATLRLFAEVAADSSRRAQCGPRRAAGSRQGGRRVARTRRAAARSSDDGPGGEPPPAGAPLASGWGA